MVKQSKHKDDNIWSDPIFDYFAKISLIPRPSGKEEKIIKFLKEFAQSHKLDITIDKVGNTLIKKGASEGYKNRCTTVLQAHVDMVCEKEANIEHDFLKDPIKPYVHNGWLKAKGTTLGADNGVGVAMILACLADNTLSHGPIEALFTVDEESGLTGAKALEADFYKGSILINLDTEQEGEICVGCAGGVTSRFTFNFSPESPPEGYFFVQVEIDRLRGGHSGDDIDKGYANANKILAHFLNIVFDKYDARLCHIHGGNLHNAIPRQASAIIALPSAYKENIRVDFNIFCSDVEAEYYNIESGIRFVMSSTDASTTCMDKKTSINLIHSLRSVHNGVYRMSSRIPGLVQTSTNLASIRMENNSVVVVASQRSMSDWGLSDVVGSVKSTFRLAGANVAQSDGYPGWEPNLQSEILKIAVPVYQELFGVEPKVKAIHAGLECGLFLKNRPELDMISIGPTILGAHSPSERLEITTVKKSWDFLLAILRNIPPVETI
ncbi:MAG TPA: aminoacyl-histidine dipeptidase [Bacteroidaceae bacterium]|nr:aminoacyl-histidine dipeptidase [Bacteroidaceae bacterium]